MSLTRADMGVWLINLPRAVRRRASMDAQLQAMGVHYTVFDGVDGVAQKDELINSIDLHFNTSITQHTIQSMMMIRRKRFASFVM